MKPDWKDAPAWANWLVQDMTGDWWWSENKPELIRNCWYTSGRMLLHTKPEPTTNWKDTLEQRPEEVGSEAHRT